MTGADGRRGGGGRVAVRLLPAAVFGLLLLLAWQGLVVAAHVPAVLLPSPAGVAASMSRAVPLLAAGAWATAVTAVAGFVVAVGAGLVLAAGMALSTVMAGMLAPNLVLFQLVPKVALGPLFVVWLGTGLPARLAFTAFVSLFPIAVGALAGLRAADPGHMRLCRVLGAAPWQVFGLVQVPTALPYVFAGAKVAATLAFTGAVVAEFIASDAGLGHLVQNAASQSDTPLVFAALLVLSVLGAALYAVVALLERAARQRWGRP